MIKSTTASVKKGQPESDRLVRLGKRCAFLFVSKRQKKTRKEKVMKRKSKGKTKKKKKRERACLLSDYH